MEKKDIVIVDYCELSIEGWLDFHSFDLDAVCKIAKAKKQPKGKIGITNVKQNYSFFLKTYRNVNAEYSEKLKVWNARNKK